MATSLRGMEECDVAGGCFVLAIDQGHKRNLAERNPTEQRREAGRKDRRMNRQTKQSKPKQNVGGNRKEGSNTGVGLGTEVGKG